MQNPKQLNRIVAIQSKMKKFEESYLDIPKTDPWVPIMFRDQQLKFELSYESAQKIQREHGLNIFGGELKMEHLNDMTVMVSILLIGVQTHHPEMTLEALAPNILAKHRVYYAHCISKALEATQPSYEDLAEIVGDTQDALKEHEGNLEAGNTDAPLPEIVSSPVSGPPVG